ncbi:MAG: hypothetical protein K2M89_06340 [Clostridiales bacterium]|nr:hypothetical protein [Clostridiales bacterium]
MSFQIPQYLQSYLDKKKDSPYSNYVNTSEYYANTNAYVMNYLNRVVRQCMAYANGAQDGAYNSGLSANIGYTAIKNATKLIKGDKTIFAGDDHATAFLSDTWAPYARFDIFLEELISYTLAGGTALFKLNKDSLGRCSLSASRVDRNTFTVVDNGDIVDVTFMLTLLSSTTSNNVNEALWLVERRYYAEDRKPTVVYHVHRKSGIAGNETMPNTDGEGLPYDALPLVAKQAVERLGIELDTPMELPYRDGLGVWASLNTATNSCVPGLRMGDPALYSTLDLLWSIDTVFSGSLIDVLNGEGKVLVPKRFLGNINAAIQKALKARPDYGTLDAVDEGDSGFVYVSTPHDKDFPPTDVQFDIRSEQYRGMWELYLKQFAVAFGYAPTTLFPYLQDASPKTAREVTAEENLTRASVQSAHRLLIPELNRAIAEVLYQAGFKGKATLQLSDYIGNKLMRDENLRQNYAAGLIPHETAVQIANGLSAKETAEYMAKIATEQKETAFGGKQYDDTDYFGG